MLAAMDEIVHGSGVSDVTIGNLCRRAGYTRGAFYSNFDSLDSVFLALHQERVDRFLVRATEASRRVLDDWSGHDSGLLVETIGAVLEALAADETWFIVHDRVYARMFEDESVRKRYRETRARIFGGFASLLEEVLDAAGREATGSVDELARLLWSAATGVLRELADGDGRDALDDTRVLAEALLEACTQPTATTRADA